MIKKFVQKGLKKKVVKMFSGSMAILWLIPVIMFLICTFLFFWFNKTISFPDMFIFAVTYQVASIFIVVILILLLALILGLSVPLVRKKFLK